MKRVVTESSVYELDGDTLRRVPMTTDAANLRGDGECVELVQVLACEVGRPAVFVIQLPNVEGPTIRRTTLVRHISQ